jgi:hypothetical protein
MHKEKLLETDLRMQLLVTSRDGERSGKTEKKPSRLLQRLLVVTLIVSKSAHRPPTNSLTAMVHHTITTQLLTNAVPNANALIQP